MSGQTNTQVAALTAGTWLQWRAGQLSGQTSMSPVLNVDASRASMEGRTIVRPDLHCSVSWSERRTGFNGGPDNCPARPSRGLRLVTAQLLLQWRAGQLSGQTRSFPAELMLVMTASMEGRTIVRPDPGQDRPTAVAHANLQWRAGQLSGQTRTAGRRSRRR